MNRAMSIKEETLLDFLGTPNKVLEIPRYQRAYSWEAEQCDEFWRDILRAARAKRTHFAGALLHLDRAEGNVAIRSIVDGQQRLTTVTLIIAALGSYLNEQGETLFGMGGDDLVQMYLKTNGSTKLQLSHADRTTLDAIALGNALPKHPSPHVHDNYTRFSQKMREPSFDALELWQGLGSLRVVVISLGSSEHAPEVFESLNSKGVPLTTADLVRNYLLLSESRSEQTRLYTSYWEPIQGCFGDDPGSIRLDNAILGWLSVRFRQVRKFGDKQAFSIFKSFCEDEYDGTVDALLEELYAFCLVWAENYRYHAVKKYKSADWARLGTKTRVSGRPRAALDHPESRDYYQKHFGVDPQW